MRHYPVFLDLRDRRIVVSGAGEMAVAKLRLLMKTEARIAVYGADAGATTVRGWAARGPAGAGRAAARGRRRRRGGAASTAPTATRPRTRGRRRSAAPPGALVNIVDNLEGSDFITPAIVDRDPVTVAIGTEGAAPVLARKIKAEVEAMLPATLGLLTRIGQGFRARVEALDSKARRGVLDPLLLRARARGRSRPARTPAREALERLLAEGEAAAAGRRAPRRRRPRRSGAPDAEGAAAAARGRRGDPRPAGAAGDPGARPARGDDRRGRQDRPTAPSWKQADINALIVEHARAGADGGAAEGRRPGGLRPARRGDRGAGGGGHRLRRSCRA